MKIVTLLAGAVVLAAPLAALAANADHPYQNVDHSNDAGNNTGDGQVDSLNQAQLNSDGIPARAYPPAHYGYAGAPYGYAPPPPPFDPSAGYLRQPQRYGGY